MAIFHRKAAPVSLQKPNNWSHRTWAWIPKGKERRELYFGKAWISTTFLSYLLSPCVKEQQMIPGQRKRCHRRNNSPHALTVRNQKPSRLPQMMMEARNVFLIFNPYFLVKRQWTNLPRILQQCKCDKSLNRRNSIHRFTGTIFRFYTSKIFTYFTSKASDSTYFTAEVFDLL